MPQHDDQSVLNHFTLIRAIRPDWILTENGQERLTSAAFKDGGQEASCFIAEEVGGIEGFERDIMPLLEEEFGFAPRVATIQVVSAREGDLWVYRKPEEFHGNAAHVVICPSGNMSKSRYARQAGGLKDHAILRDDARAHAEDRQYDT